MRLYRLASLVFSLCFVSVGYAQPVSPDSIVICSGTVHTFMATRSRAPGQIIKREWDFDDPLSDTLNTSSEEKVEHYFSQAGKYLVKQIIFSEGGDIDTIFTSVRVMPTPQPTIETKQACAGTPTELQATLAKTGWKNLSWKWDFGDKRMPETVASPSHVYRKPGVYQVSLQVIPPSGCTAKVSRKINVFPVPDAVKTVGDTICFGERAELKALSTDSLEVHWFSSVNDQLSLHVGNLFLSPPLPYKAVFFAAKKSDNGCFSSRVPVSASVFTQESAHIYSEPPSPIEWPSRQIRLGVRSTSGLQTVYWDFGDGDTISTLRAVHAFDGPGEYIVRAVVQNSRGCKVEIAQKLLLKFPPAIFLPAAFSPNKDGINDVFKADSHELETCFIRIYNSAGELVFISDTPSFVWDGNNLKGIAVPEDVYIFQIKGKDIRGKLVEKEGAITLVR